jgi:hypothetical protein
MERDMEGIDSGLVAIVDSGELRRILGKEQKFSESS